MTFATTSTLTSVTALAEPNLQWLRVYRQAAPGPGGS